MKDNKETLDKKTKTTKSRTKEARSIIPKM